MRRIRRLLEGRRIGRVPRIRKLADVRFGHRRAIGIRAVRIMVPERRVSRHIGRFTIAEAGRLIVIRGVRRPIERRVRVNIRR
jgi:hypothetical protein